jgi:uncharacterized membrane protein
MKDDRAAQKRAANLKRKAAEYDWQTACLESQEREKQERALRAEAESKATAMKLELTGYRATEKAFYEKLRALGLPEGGYLLDTINVFAEVAKLRERVAELEAKQ